MTAQAEKIAPRRKTPPVGGFLDKTSSFHLDKSRYSDTELKQFEAIILHDRQIAVQEIQFLKNLLPEDHDEKEKDWSEISAEDSSKETLMLLQRQVDHVANLDAALERIANKSYGICKETNKLIDPDRLYAHPVATATKAAKEQAKKQPQYN